jgi:hypothetical protein
MASFARTLEHRYVKPALRRIWPWRHKNLNGMRVHYVHRLDGGGSAFGQEYIPYLRNRGMPRQMRTFEWCSGPGFIGFSLLGCGLTETLCLADINPEAVAACRRTIADNTIGARVEVYVSDNLASIPHSEQWDLVVGKSSTLSRHARRRYSGARSAVAHSPHFLRAGRRAFETRRPDRPAGEQPRFNGRNVSRNDSASGPRGLIRGIWPEGTDDTRPHLLHRHCTPRR